MAQLICGLVDMRNKKKLMDTIEALGEQKNKFFAIVDDDGDAAKPF